MAWHYRESKEMDQRTTTSAHDNVPECPVDHDHVGIDRQPDGAPQMRRRIGDGCSTDAVVIVGKLVSV